MANTFRKKSDWTQIGLVFVAAVVLMVIDSRTQWLQAPRNALSVALTPVQAVASIPSNIGNMVSGALSSEADVKIAYENLRKEYFVLKSETLLLQALKQENQDLRSLLDASKRLKEKITLAELVNVNINRDNHTVLVEKGLQHGVYVGQAVIDDKGVIGQVTDVMPYNSSVLLITDPGHATPVQVERTGLRTLVYGTGSVAVLKVPFLNQNTDIQKGDILISSGLGGRFPRGYPVAEITEVNTIQDQEFMQVRATPIAKLDSSNHVLLLSKEAIAEEVVELETNDNSEVKPDKVN